MEKNFKIDQSNAIRSEGLLYDLHNQYDYRQMTVYNDRIVEIVFTPHEVHGEGLPTVMLRFSGIDYLELSPGFCCRADTDLDEVGYISPDQRDDRSILEEARATPADHLFFRFHSGFIRLHAERARIRVWKPGRLEGSAQATDLSNPGGVKRQDFSEEPES